MKTLRRLTVNVSGRVRRVVKDGREYLVAPLTLIVPGVLNGSKGALYYPPEEIRKNYDSWNGVPLVVGHPKIGGQHVSARDPNVMESHGIGTVYSAAVRNGKLTAEGWFDAKKTAKIDRRILDSLNAGRRIEISTGLFTDNIPSPGITRNGQSYSHIARNYRPDHLAILPDEIGACSIHDGCGVLVNKRSTPSCKCKGTCTKCKGTKMPLTANQRETLVAGLINAGDVWTEDDEATLNSLDDTQLLGLRKQSLALNCMGMGGEHGKGKKNPVLNADEDEEDVIVEADDEEMEASEEEEAPVPEEEEKPAMVGNKLTAAQFYEMAPPEVKEALKEAVAVRNEKKGQLIRQLTANVKDEKKRELVVNKLKDKTIDELREIADLIPTTNSTPRSDNPFANEPNYLGAAGFSAPLTLNTEEREDILPLPTIDWSQKSA